MSPRPPATPRPRAAAPRKAPQGSTQKPPAKPQQGSTQKTPRTSSQGSAQGSPRGSAPGRPAAGATAAQRVSPTSAERFARRVLWRRRKRLLAGLAVVAVLAGLAWVVLGSAWLRVADVEVTGTVRLDPARVERAAQSEMGTPMALADTGRLHDVVLGQPQVKDVEVQRAWPHTLRVVVTERTPVAAVPSGSGFSLVDGEGVVVESVEEAPDDVAVVRVDLVDSRAASSLAAAVAVLDALPADLRGTVRTIGADGPDSVWFVLQDDARVLWGSAEESALKADVLRALLPQEATEYDVSSPRAPAVRGGTG